VEELVRQNAELRRANAQLEKSCANHARQRELLVAKEQELAAIYENTPLTMLLVGFDGRIYKANRFAENFARDGGSNLIGVQPGDALNCAHASRCAKGCGTGMRCHNCTLLSIVRDTLKTGRAYHRAEVELLLSRESPAYPATMLISSARISVHGEPRALITIEDITKRKETELRVAQLNRVRALLGGVDHAIVHNSDPKKLLNEICRVAVTKGGFKLAWVGLIEPDGSLRPAAKAGQTEYLKHVRVVVRDVPHGRGPMGLAVRKNRPVIANDVVHDPRMKPWQEQAKRYGLRYAAAFPISVADKAVGAIGLYAPHAGFFDKDEVGMLSLISDEISFALTAIDTAAKRKRATEASLRSESELADFFDHSPLGLLWVGPDGTIQRINQAELNLLDTTMEAALGRAVQSLHDDPEIITQLLDRLAAGETVKDFRARIRQKDGAIKHFLIDANGLWVRKRLKHTRWFVWDVTRLVELEREILTICEQVQRQLGLDLHDDLGQQLASIEFLSQALASQLAAKSGGASSHAKKIGALAQQALAKTRQLSHCLFPVGLDHDGLTNALRDLAGNVRQIYKINASFRAQAPARWLNPTTSIHLFRIAQEAVNNAIKHGKARRIEISLAASATNVVLTVKNNGRRFPMTSLSEKGIGLRLMHYRASLIGGSLFVKQNADGKLAVICKVRKRLQIPAAGNNL
jgi:signal transduction histidine kinase